MGSKAQVLTKELLASVYASEHSWGSDFLPGLDNEELEWSCIWAQARKIEANFRHRRNGLQWSGK